MKIITKRKQDKIDKTIIRKLRFVAMTMVQAHAKWNTKEEYEKLVKFEMDRAEQVFYADDVILQEIV